MTKRSHGSGNISRRGENSWRLRYYVGDVRHAVTFRGTKKEAEAELRRLLGDADKGMHIAPAKLTLKQWADQWIELKAAERQHKTVARYEDLLRLHVMPKLGDRLLQQIRTHEINLLYAQMTSLAPRTRHHVATVLKSCLQAAMDSKLIGSNPAGGKRPSPGDAEVGQALDQDQIAALVEGFRGSTLFEIVCVLVFTGMRRGEALALRWSDFDAASKTLRIDRALEYTQKYKLQFKAPKSARGRRTIALDDFLVRLLSKEREKYLRVVAGAPDGADVDLSLVRLPSDWLVFPAPGGPFDAPRHPDSVTKQFTKRAAGLGFPIRLHDLRVSHGTWLLDQGTPVHTVAKRLGHDASVLLKVYAKRTQKSDEATAATIGNMTKGMQI